MKFNIDRDRGIYTEEMRKHARMRVQRAEEEKARSHRAWLRLCGMAAPIGGISER